MRHSVFRAWPSLPDKFIMKVNNGSGDVIKCDDKQRLNELGVTALWFTPVLENNSPDHGKSSTYHGYATTVSRRSTFDAYGSSTGVSL